MNPATSGTPAETHFWDVGIWALLLAGIAFAAASLVGNWIDRLGPLFVVLNWTFLLGGLAAIVLRIRKDVGRARGFRQSMAAEPGVVARDASTRLRGTAFFAALAAVMLFSNCGAGTGNVRGESGAVADPAHYWPPAAQMLGLVLASLAIPVLGLVVAGRLRGRWLGLGVLVVSVPFLLGALAVTYYWLPTGCYGSHPGQCGAAISGLSVFFALGWPPVLTTLLGVVADARASASGSRSSSGSG